MKLNFVAKFLVGFLFAAVLAAFSPTQLRVTHSDAIEPAIGADQQQISQAALVDLDDKLVPPAVDNLQRGLGATSTTTGPSKPNAISTPGPYNAFLPDVVNQQPTPTVNQQPTPTETPTKPEPPAVSPTPGWPDGLASRTSSKLGLHVVRNNDPYIMEYVRRVRPRVMKSVDDLGWLSDVKLASPNTMTLGRLSGQNESWPEELAPDAAARQFIDTNLNKYRLNPGVDYWEGWNEFVPVTEARWKWYAAFEAARACDMQALGLHAAIGGFVGGAPEYNEIPYFLPAIEAAHRCGGILTMHEGVSPLPGCGVFIDQAGIIPGAPAFPGITMGYLMLRYRFWYEGYLKPRGWGDLRLVISEVAVGGIVPGQPCNGPGGASWKDFSSFWVQHGVGPNGPQAWTNLLAWYDSYLRQDPYVVGTTIFTAGGLPGWDGNDMHDVIIPLSYYETSQH
jgi:hypothetical protein